MVYRMRNAFNALPIYRLATQSIDWRAIGQSTNCAMRLHKPIQCVEHIHVDCLLICIFNLHIQKQNVCYTTVHVSLGEKEKEDEQNHY